MHIKGQVGHYNRLALLHSRLFKMQLTGKNTAMQLDRFECPLRVHMCLLRAGPNDCTCPTTGSLVCGADGRTYQNACTAGCAKTSVASQGPCPANPKPITPIIVNKCACARDSCDCT